MEEFLDEAYDRFVAKREGSTKLRKRAKKEAQSEDAKLLEVWCSCIACIVENSLCCIAQKNLFQFLISAKSFPFQVFLMFFSLLVCRSWVI